VEALEVVRLAEKSRAALGEVRQSDLATAIGTLGTRRVVRDAI
jgi:hypothetical protein